MTALRWFHALALLAGWLRLVSSAGIPSYLDPGTGSFVTQMLIAGLAGALLTLKMFWRRVKLFFTSRKAGKKEGISKLDDAR